MYEYLKVLFKDGEALTFEQLTEKLAETKELKLANLADGGYVSKDKFEAKETELTGVREQLATANTTIQSYKDMDVDGIKRSVSDWEQKYNTDTENLRRQLAEQEQNHSLDMFLGGYSFSSKAAKDGIRADFISKKFPYENGKFIGAAEYMDSLKASDDYKNAFVTEPSSTEPKKPQFSDPNPDKNSQLKQKVSLSELMRRKNENPNAEIKFD